MLYGLKFEANQTEGIFPQNVLSQIESILQDQLHPWITTITIRSENYSDPNTDVLRWLICEYFWYFDQEKLKPQGGMMFTPGKAYDINIQYNPYPKDIYERIKWIWITPYVPDTPPPSLSK